MRRTRIIAGTLLVASAVCMSAAPNDGAMAAPEVSQIEHEQVLLRYTYTQDAHVSLTFAGGKAVCSGTIIPDGSYDATITLSLYKKGSNGWSYITSWTGRATGGAKAIASGSTTVSHGTYLLEARGNVGGLEYPVAQVIRTY